MSPETNQKAVKRKPQPNPRPIKFQKFTPPIEIPESLQDLVRDIQVNLDGSMGSKDIPFISEFCEELMKDPENAEIVENLLQTKENMTKSQKDKLQLLLKVMERGEQGLVITDGDVEPGNDDFGPKRENRENSNSGGFGQFEEVSNGFQGLESLAGVDLTKIDPKTVQKMLEKFKNPKSQIGQNSGNGGGKELDLASLDPDMVQKGLEMLENSKEDILGTFGEGHHGFDFIKNMLMEGGSRGFGGFAEHFDHGDGEEEKQMRPKKPKNRVFPKNQKSQLELNSDDEFDFEDEEETSLITNRPNTLKGHPSDLKTIEKLGNFENSKNGQKTKKTDSEDQSALDSALSNYKRPDRTKFHPSMDLIGQCKRIRDFEDYGTWVNGIKQDASRIEREEVRKQQILSAVVQNLAGKSEKFENLESLNSRNLTRLVGSKLLHGMLDTAVVSTTHFTAFLLKIFSKNRFFEFEFISIF